MNDNFYGNGANGQVPPILIEPEGQIKKMARGIFSRAFVPFSIFFAVCYGALFIIELAVSIFLPSKVEALYENPYFIMGLNVLCMYILAFPVFLFFSLRNKENVRKREKSKLKISEFLVLLLICEGCMFVGSLIGNVLNVSIGAILGGEITNGVEDLITTTPLWLIIVVAVIIGPVIEELMFRKVLIDRLSIFGDLWAIVFSAAAFGFFHGNLYQFFYAAFIGIILGYVYTKSGKIIYPIIMHIIINFMGSAIPMLLMDGLNEYLAMSDALLAGEEVNMRDYFVSTLIYGGYTLLQYAIYIAGVVLLVYFLRKRAFSLKSGDINLGTNKTLEVGILNVGALVFLAVSLVLIALNLIPAPAA